MLMSGDGKGLRGVRVHASHVAASHSCTRHLLHADCYGCSDLDDDNFYNDESDDYDDVPGYPGQLQALVDGAWLQQGIDAIWPLNVRQLSPEQQLLRAAAVYLATAEPWSAPGVQPHSYTAALSQLGLILSDKPCGHALPSKLSRLFDGSPYFEQLAFGNQGSAALVRLNVDAVLAAGAEGSDYDASVSGK